MKRIYYKLQMLLAFGALLMVFTQCSNKFYKTGMQFYDSGNYEDAIKQFTQWIEEDPDKAKAYIARAEAYEKIGNKSEAAMDYSRAGTFEKDEDRFMKAAKLYMDIENYEKVSEMARKAIAQDRRMLNAHKLNMRALINLEAYSRALWSSNKLLELEESAGNYYWHGFISAKLKRYKKAEHDFRKAIELAPKMLDSYIALAEVLYILESYNQALVICQKGLNLDKRNKTILKIRSKVYHDQFEYPKAINDLSTILLFNSDDEEIFFIRGKYYQEFNQSMNALNDFSKVIKLKPDNDEAYYLRGKANEEVTNYQRAASDYEKFIELAGEDSLSQERIAEVKGKLFELKKEMKPPGIILSDSLEMVGNMLVIRGDTKKIKLTGIVEDESNLKYTKANGKEATILHSGKEEHLFEVEVDVESSNEVLIKAEDVYGNVTNLALDISRTEVVSPEIELKTPYASDNGEIYLQNDNPKLYVEGLVEDQSLIKSVYIDDVMASFSDKLENPQFSATIDIANKKRFVIKAMDQYGNTSEQEFTLNREGVYISEDNPMGKTWVVFIENSEYQTFASLDGPVKDVSRIKTALANYRIHNFIHKKNMTKEEMERFFSIELRDLVRLNQVNSLLIWYAGHGKFLHESGYWVPINAKRDDEFSYFNINNLKASMQSYSDFLTHTLVITDACESGPSFYQAMRSESKERDCGNWKDTRAKSAQVLSSAGYELAVDQSQFTESFANTLVNNPNACIPIEDVVLKVTVAVAKSGRQEPQFGKIDGLRDEGGTFFFISKQE